MITDKKPFTPLEDSNRVIIPNMQKRKTNIFGIIGGLLVSHAFSKKTAHKHERQYAYQCPDS